MLTDKYRIRNANAGDIIPLSSLITELGYPCTAEEVQVRFDHISDNPDYRTVVITDENSLIGMAGLVKGLWYEKNGTYLRILAFVISEKYRGQGVGKLLMQYIEDYAAELGVNALVVSSGNRDDRITAHHFYKSMGFVNKSSGFIKQL